MAAERRGGRGAANSLGKGAGSARPPRRTHARRAPPGRLAAAERPAPTVRTLAEEEPCRPPRDARPPEACRGPLEGAGGHLFLQLGAREPRRGTRALPPSPTTSGAGGPERVTASPLRVFPPTLTL